MIYEEIKVGVWVGGMNGPKIPDRRKLVDRLQGFHLVIVHLRKKKKFVILTPANCIRLNQLFSRIRVRSDHPKGRSRREAERRNVPIHKGHRADHGEFSDGDPIQYRRSCSHPRTLFNLNGAKSFWAYALERLITDIQ